MRLLTGILTVGLLAATPSAALAAVFAPSPSDLGDLDHSQAYAWKIDVSSVQTANVTAATLTFKNIFNWDTSANELYIHLFDKLSTTSPPPVGGTTQGSWIGTNVYKWTDNAGNNVISDAYSSTPSWVVGNVSLTQFSFPGCYNGNGGDPCTGTVQGPDTGTGSWNPGDQMTGPVSGVWTYNDPGTNAGTWTATYGSVKNGKQYYDYTYTFSAGELGTLNTYIDDGWIALGFDPDCHFYNDGASLNLTTTPNVPQMPEPASLILFGTGLAGIRAFRRRKKTLLL